MTDSIIGLLVSISNLFISVFDRNDDSKDFNDDELENHDLLKEDSFNLIDGENKLINSNPDNVLFGSRLNLSRIFNNEDIYEYLEDKYLNSQAMFANSKNINAIDGQDSENKNGLGSFSNLKYKLIAAMLDNRLYRIDSSEDLFKLFIVVLSVILIVTISIDLFVSFELSMAFFMFFLLSVSFIIYLPRIRKDNRYSSISKELPYALRQLSTELRAGKSLFDALDSIVESDYGVLSAEFSRVLEEIKYGETSENAFLNLEKRVNSKALSRVIYEILASLRIGSNLSNSLNIIAEDVNFDMRMKLKEYSEKLNVFIMIYTFLAILAPVIILTMLLAASVVVGDIVPGSLLLILYGLFFPMIIVFLAFSIKKLEPRL